MSSKDLREAITQCFIDTYMQTEGNIELFDTDETIRALLQLFEDYAKAERVNELDKLMSSRVMLNSWFPELDIYYNARIQELTRPSKEDDDG